MDAVHSESPSPFTSIVKPVPNKLRSVDDQARSINDHLHKISDQLATARVLRHEKASSFTVPEKQSIDSTFRRTEDALSRVATLTERTRREAVHGRVKTNTRLLHIFKDPSALRIAMLQLEATEQNLDRALWFLTNRECLSTSSVTCMTSSEHGDDPFLRAPPTYEEAGFFDEERYVARQRCASAQPALVIDAYRSPESMWNICARALSAVSLPITGYTSLGGTPQLNGLDFNYSDTTLTRSTSDSRTYPSRSVGPREDDLDFLSFQSAIGFVPDSGHEPHPTSPSTASRSSEDAAEDPTDYEASEEFQFSVESKTITLESSSLMRSNTLPSEELFAILPGTIESQSEDVSNPDLTQGDMHQSLASTWESPSTPTTAIELGHEIMHDTEDQHMTTASAPITPPKVPFSIDVHEADDRVSDFTRGCPLTPSITQKASPLACDAGCGEPLASLSIGNHNIEPVLVGTRSSSTYGDLTQHLNNCKVLSHMRSFDVSLADDGETWTTPKLKQLVASQLGRPPSRTSAATVPSRTTEQPSAAMPLTPARMPEVAEFLLQEVSATAIPAPTLPVLATSPFARPVLETIVPMPDVPAYATPYPRSSTRVSYIPIPDVETTSKRHPPPIPPKPKPLRLVQPLGMPNLSSSRA